MAIFEEFFCLFVVKDDITSTKRSKFSASVSNGEKLSATNNSFLPKFAN